VSGSAGQSPRWWWFVLGFWRTIPIVTALVIGYAIGHPTLGALMGLAFLLSGFVLLTVDRSEQLEARR
jgi:hypothetical protein